MGDVVEAAFCFASAGWWAGIRAGMHPHAGAVTVLAVIVLFAARHRPFPCGPIRATK